MTTESTTGKTISVTDPGAWPLLIGLGCVRALAALPESTWRPVSRVLGRLMWHLASSRRHVVDVNLQIAFGGMSADERAFLGRQCFSNLMLSLIEAGKLWFGPADFASKRVTVEGLDLLERANNETPVLLATPHFMSIELVGAAISQQVPLSAFYARAKNPHFDRFEVAKRLRYAKSVIERRQTLRMVRALKAGGVLWWIPDHAVGANQGAVESVFFGRPVLSSRATAWLLDRTDVQVMLVSIERQADGQIVATVNPPLQNLSGEDEVVTSRLDTHFEELILQQPDEYFWMHRRFKPVNASDPNPYSRT